MKHSLRSFLIVLLGLTLAVSPLVVSPHGALASGANYDQQYELAIGLLRDLLNADNLREAARLFRELGSQSLSRYYVYYTDVILRLQEDDAAAIGEALDTLDFLEMNEAFTADLAARKLPGCADLRRYGEARQLELGERYAEAQAIFASLSILDAIDRTVRLNPLAREEQRQAEERAEAERKAAEEAARKAAEEAARAKAVITAGDVVTFGRYEQDNDLANGPEAIEWIALEVRGDRALLLSQYGLNALPFHHEATSVQWRDSDIRRWLNEIFLNAAFSAREREGILTTDVDNSAAQGMYPVTGWSDTEDRVFLLSYAETRRIATGTLSCQATAYARDARGALYSDVEDKALCSWWLRSPGESEGSAMGFSPSCTVGYEAVDLAGVAVRPTLWVYLNADVLNR